MHAHWYSWYAIALLGYWFSARDTLNTEEKTLAQAIAREWVSQIALSAGLPPTPLTNKESKHD